MNGSVMNRSATNVFGYEWSVMKRFVLNGHQNGCNLYNQASSLSANVRVCLSNFYIHCLITEVFVLIFPSFRSFRCFHYGCGLCILNFIYFAQLKISVQ